MLCYVYFDILQFSEQFYNGNYKVDLHASTSILIIQMVGSRAQVCDSLATLGPTQQNIEQYSILKILLNVLSQNPLNLPYFYNFRYIFLKQTKNQFKQSARQWLNKILNRIQSNNIQKPCPNKLITQQFSTVYCHCKSWSTTQRQFLYKILIFQITQWFPIDGSQTSTDPYTTNNGLRNKKNIYARLHLRLKNITIIAQIKFRYIKGDNLRGGK